MRQYVIHIDNKLSVCGHDEVREREKATVMAFRDDRDMQGFVRREAEWNRKSLIKSVPTVAVFCFSENMPFKKSDS